MILTEAITPTGFSQSTCARNYSSRLPTQAKLRPTPAPTSSNAVNPDLTPSDIPPQSSSDLLADLQEIIRRGKSQAVAAVNSALTVTFWHVGKRINEEVLHGERAAYGKQVIASLSENLVAHYGKSFVTRNLRRMMQFAELFPDFQIVSALATQLSWTHFLTLIPLKSQAARSFYAAQAAQAHWSGRELTRQIERKAFERSKIADSKLELAATPELSGSFKDPYFFEFLGLPDGGGLGTQAAHRFD